MKRFWIRSILGVLVVSSLLVLGASAQRDVLPDHEALKKTMNAGNYKEAYDGFSRRALNSDAKPHYVPYDLEYAVRCLNQLGRIKEFDAFIEKVIAAHPDNPQLLAHAASQYANVNHSGVIVAGEFVRGPHRGGQAKYVNSFERDRVRAIQLLVSAIKQAKNKSLLSSLNWQLANQFLANRGYSEAWRLQYLTDLATLPDYEESHYYHGRSGRGAPVDKDGNPVLHYKPKTWEAAITDGERWRWALSETVNYDANARTRVESHFAGFLHNQFGVQTMQQYGRFFAQAQSDDSKKDESGPYALHTLAENETIARLAAGIKRFKLPDEFNFIRIYDDLADGRGGYQEQSLNTLAQIFENRRQYDRAAGYWRRSIRIRDHNNWKKNKLDQIVNNWGTFERLLTQPAGQDATVEFRFRNGNEVTFTAYEIRVNTLLDDMKAYLKSSPRKLQWEQVRVSEIGGRLVRENQGKYIGNEVAQWDMKLEPRPNHFDRRMTVTTPLKQAGAYLLTAKMKAGNTSRIIIWLADTAIVKKPMDKSFYCFVADAVTGKPIPKANVEFFGYRQGRKENLVTRGYHHVVHTSNFAEFTDQDGQVFLDPASTRNYQWVIIATTPEGRLAYLGFTGGWVPDYHDREYNQTKTFAITDRPVYRPQQTVKFKVWVNHAKYDREGNAPYAGRDITVEVRNPKNEKIFSKSFTADQYGGINGEFILEKQASLGVYYINLPNIGGGGNFRVEEYKKPEFEVKVEAPKEPVMVGEKITARIEAKYYFGAPVTEATVKYKILRTVHSATWYPIGGWDWFYGPGYWWFAYDYNWYPGWSEWGCKRPHFVWWGWNPQPQPEVVAEVEKPIGKDGVIEITIDTAVAKALQGDTDHKYQITAEVTDQSRRTIVGQGAVLVARKPFKVTAWVDRGHYRVGDVVHASFRAHTLDSKPVQGKGKLKLLRVTYDKNMNPVEKAVQTWNLDTNDQGAAELQMKASRGGQYRLSYNLTDAKGHVIEGGYVFCVMGAGFDDKNFRFNNIELVTDKREYKPGDRVKLMINTDRVGSTVLLFVRAANGVCLRPRILRLDGKSTVEYIEVTKKDMPNFFVEAVTVADGKVYNDVREVIVPPEDRVLTVEVLPSADKYKPGEKAKIKIKLTEPNGEPFSGSVVVSIYDKAVEYISGGSNVPEIKAFFWKWRRNHRPQTESSLSKGGYNLTRPKEIAMQFIGAFGHLMIDKSDMDAEDEGNGGEMDALRRNRSFGMAKSKMAMADGMVMESAIMAPMAEKKESEAGGAPGQATVEPSVRTNFADTALWVGALHTQKNGTAEVELTMPENLTTWKTRVWAMGDGTRVGEGTAEIITTKDLIIRLQAPRFFVQKDEVVLSANVHNYLKTAKSVRVILELDGPCLAPMAENLTQTIKVDANGEKRVDWRVKVTQPGEAIICMKALTDEESDAMQMKFPVYIHGMLKTESFSGVIRPDRNSATIAIRVPAERLPEQSRLEIRYSPTLAGAMVDALPYLADYPYGCTEQTLNRFLPTVITQKVLLDMNLDLKDIQAKRTNLNAQEIGDDVERAKQWKRFDRNPVFDEDLVRDMVKGGVNRLASMQCSDGGWGWFSGWGEYSYPHTTAVVIHGFQIARQNDVAIVPDVFNRGIAWLKQYQDEQLRYLKNAKTETKPWKDYADNLDAMVYMVLVDEKMDNTEMREFLYRDRNHLAVYAKAMFGIALHRVEDLEKRDMIIRNIEQYLVEDDENQTAYLRLPNSGYWWYWYGSEYEAHAYYLKLLCVTNPKSRIASRMVKYLLNNRKHATYWKSTRDTALCVEAFADYIRASGEDKPDMTLTVLIDGEPAKKVRITRDNLFTFDNKLVLTGDRVTTGKHNIELKKEGTGPIYFNAYLTNFTLEDPITRAGLEIKVNRKYYKLVRVDKTIKVEGARGQALDQKVEKYKREELANLALVTSGDLVEVELVIESKNDYEYIIFEDMKAAGFEPVEVRSGYNGNEMGAYVEFRDERTVFFVRTLARGKHSISYRMRAEIPGKFSALPAKASAMYAPELKANSDEIKLRIQDQPGTH